MELLPAALLSVAGLLCLYGSWCKQPLFRPWGAWGGWALLFASGWVWSLAAASVEFGIVYALLAPTACAWVLVLHNRQARNRRAPAPAEAGISLPALPVAARHLLLFVGAVPLAGAAAAYGSTALATFLPWQPGNALVLAMLVMPVVWGAGAYWLCADPKPLRPTLGLATLLAFGALVLNP